MSRTYDERVALIPQNRHVSYTLRDKDSLFWYAWWYEDGKPKSLYLGKDKDGQFARQAAQQQKRVYQLQPKGKPCGHKQVQLSCLVCIMAARNGKRSA